MMGPHDRAGNGCSAEGARTGRDVARVVAAGAGSRAQRTSAPLAHAGNNRPERRVVRCGVTRGSGSSRRDAREKTERRPGQWTNDAQRPVAARGTAIDARERGRRSLGRRGWGGRGGVWRSELALEGLPPGPRHGVPEAVVADLVHAAREDVLQEAPQELLARQGHGAPPRSGGLRRLLIGERDMRVVHGHDPRVGDRDAVDVAREIAEHGGPAWTVGLQ